MGTCVQPATSPQTTPLIKVGEPFLIQDNSDLKAHARQLAAQGAKFSRFDASFGGVGPAGTRWKPYLSTDFTAESSYRMDSPPPEPEPSDKTTYTHTIPVDLATEVVTPEVLVLETPSFNTSEVEELETETPPVIQLGVPFGAELADEATELQKQGAAFSWRETEWQDGEWQDCKGHCRFNVPHLCQEFRMDSPPPAQEPEPEPEEPTHPKAYGQVTLGQPFILRSQDDDLRDELQQLQADGAKFSWFFDSQWRDYKNTDFPARSYRMETPPNAKAEFVPPKVGEPFYGSHDTAGEGHELRVWALDQQVKGVKFEAEFDPDEGWDPPRTNFKFTASYIRYRVATPALGETFTVHGKDSPLYQWALDLQDSGVAFGCRYPVPADPDPAWDDDGSWPWNFDDQDAEFRIAPEEQSASADYSTPVATPTLRDQLITAAQEDPGFAVQAVIDCYLALKEHGQTYDAGLEVYRAMCLKHIESMTAIAVGDQDKLDKTFQEVQAASGEEKGC